MAQCCTCRRSCAGQQTTRFFRTRLKGGDGRHFWRCASGDKRLKQIQAFAADAACPPLSGGLDRGWMNGVALMLEREGEQLPRVGATPACPFGPQCHLLCFEHDLITTSDNLRYLSVIQPTPSIE